MTFKLDAPFEPAGGQPEAIKELTENFENGAKRQTLLGITGSGKSLDYTEILLITKKDGTLEKIQIGEYVERHLNNPTTLGDTQYEDITGDKIVSFNPNNKKIEEKIITQVSRHKSDELYEVMLDDNTTIKVTADHNCFIFENGEFNLKETKDLRIGDFLPLSNVTFKPEKPIKIINLLEYNKKNRLNIKRFLDSADIDEAKLLRILRKETQAPGHKLKHIKEEKNKRGIPQHTLKRICEETKSNLVDSLRNSSVITTAGDRMSPIVDIDEDFLTLCGLYVSEGHGGRHSVIISNTSPHLQDTVKRWCENHNVSYSLKEKKDLWCYSVIISRFLSIFGNRSHNKQIPSEFYNLSDRDLSTFLRATFDGDGWVERASLHYCSKSKNLVDDLRRLLLRFKIISRVRMRKIKGQTYYYLGISGQSNLQSFESNIGFSINYKSDALNRTIRTVENTNVNLVPGIGSLIRNTREELGLYQKHLAQATGCNQAMMCMIETGQRQISQQLMSNMAQYLFETHYIMPELRNLEYFNFRKIVNIRKVRSTNGFVYDIAVEDNETFAVGGGNLLVHNTFVASHLINNLQKPTLIVAHNKTLAAQLYAELKDLFPDNAVEYFISYYDYYQPESYIPTTDTYIEKDASINEQIEKMRLRATASLLSRKDVIVVASISCIYGLSNPQDFKELTLQVSKGHKKSRREIIVELVHMQYERSTASLEQGQFRATGDVIDIWPPYQEEIIRIELFGDEIDHITRRHPVTGEVIQKLDQAFLFPAKQFVVPEDKQQRAIESIKEEMHAWLPELPELERQRCEKRIKYDLEMIDEVGYCSGIENYSRHFDGRKPGEPPYTLLDYFPDDFLLILDESHQTLPQSTGMYKGDYSRKKNLVEHGFRLPSAFDNRPLKFEEFEKYFKKTLFVSATPGPYEARESSEIVELIIRPTGLLDPTVEIRPEEGQIPDLIVECKKTIDKGERVLVTTLTKRMAEDLTNYLSGHDLRVRYMHSEIETLDRIELVRQLRSGDFDILVGINLLREGLDIPEVSLICILDADKQGYLRNETSLLQTFGRAARNVNGRVIMYAKNTTPAMKSAKTITEKRRAMQIRYNKARGIEPQTIRKKVAEKTREIKGVKHLPIEDLKKKIAEYEAQMYASAERLDFERAIELREIVNQLKEEL